MSITVRVAAWGEDLVVPLTEEVLRAAGFEEGTRLQVHVHQGRIIVEREEEMPQTTDPK